MISSSAFSYINILDKAADASYMRNEVLANNIANVDTPGYKRSDVDFQSVLAAELGRTKYTPLDRKIKDVDLSRLTVSPYKDHENFSYRLDDNNVDIDVENVELAANQITYQGLIQSMGEEFSRMKTAMS